MYKKGRSFINKEVHIKMKYINRLNKDIHINKYINT